MKDQMAKMRNITLYIWHEIMQPDIWPQRTRKFIFKNQLLFLSSPYLQEKLLFLATGAYKKVFQSCLWGEKNQFQAKFVANLDQSESTVASLEESTEST